MIHVISEACGEVIKEYNAKILFVVINFVVEMVSSRTRRVRDFVNKIARHATYSAQNGLHCECKCNFYKSVLCTLICNSSSIKAKA